MSQYQWFAHCHCSSPQNMWRTEIAYFDASLVMLGAPEPPTRCVVKLPGRPCIGLNNVGRFPNRLMSPTKRNWWKLEDSWVRCHQGIKHMTYEHREVKVRGYGMHNEATQAKHIFVFSTHAGTRMLVDCEFVPWSIKGINVNICQGKTSSQ